MHRDLQGKTVLVTGASRGIGAATMAAFVQEGAYVYGLARSRDALAQAVAEAGAQGALTCDMGDPAAIAEAIADICAQRGGVDILINNAAVIDPIAPLGDADPDAWSALIDINVKGVFWAIQAVLPQMLARKSGTVINISSGAARNAYEGWSAYCASKAAVAMLTQSLDLEYRAKGIRAIGLSPGTVATQMQRQIKASGINPVSTLDWEDHIPPEWPARALVWMCGAEADAHLGADISLRDADLRARLGLA